MAAVGSRFNNPGDLLAGVGWAGQGAPYASPNGLTFATFTTPEAGIAALKTDLNTAIKRGFNTVSSLVYHYLGTSTNNAANPNVANYLATVTRTTGLSANSPVSSADVPNLMRGIATAEGTISTFPQLLGGSVIPATVSPAPAGSAAPTNFLDAAGQWLHDPATAFQNAISGAGAVTSFVTGQDVQNQGTTITPSAAGAAVVASSGVDLSGIMNALNTFNSTLSGVFSKDIWERVAVVGLAIVLLVGALILLSKSPNTGVATAALAA